MLPFDPADVFTSGKESGNKSKSLLEYASSPLQHFNKWWPSVKDVAKGKFGPSGFKGAWAGAKAGYNMGFHGNSVFFIPYAGYAAATAPRGHKISAVAGSGVGFGISAVIGGAIGSAFGIPPPIAVILSGVLFQEPVDKFIKNNVQAAVDFGSNMRRSSFGGDYRDTQVAVTMRQAAAREMSGSLMNARHWLGQEGAFMQQ
jgi:hypothetical protein